MSTSKGRDENVSPETSTVDCRPRFRLSFSTSRRSTLGVNRRRCRRPFGLTFLSRPIKGFNKLEIFHCKSQSFISYLGEVLKIYLCPISPNLLPYLWRIGEGEKIAKALRKCQNGAKSPNLVTLLATFQIANCVLKTK